MTIYEIVSVCIAFSAILVSVCAIWRQSKISKENIELQRATAELSRKQLELLELEDKANERASINLELVKENKTSFRFVISNFGEVDARNVNLKLLLERPEDNPLIQSEVESKLPAPILAHGNSISLIAALHFGSPLAYRAKLTWTNPNGENAEAETYVAL